MEARIVFRGDHPDHMVKVDYYTVGEVWTQLGVREEDGSLSDLWIKSDSLQAVNVKKARWPDGTK